MKKISLLIIGISFAAAAFAQADTAKSIVAQAKIQYKLSEAKTTFYNYNYRGALNIYREVLTVEAKNARALYGVAECHYALKNFKAAQKNIEEAYALDAQIDKEIEFLYGSILHQNGELDAALERYKSFKEQNKDNLKKIADYDIDMRIAQVAYAKEQMSNPNAAVITNAGSLINTSYPEYAPCISPDGKMLVFTSRRGDTKGGGIDVNFDHLYYSDIYISTWNEESKEWNEAQPIDGKVNTEFHDGGLSFTSTGELLIYRNIFGATRSGDIYISKMSSSGKWGAPREVFDRDKVGKKKLNKLVNSTYFESSASMTADGNYFYFVSERPGGQGQADIYYIKKSGREWSEPKNIGAGINTDSDEKCVFIHPSGNLLFFSSNGYAESLGSYDLYYCYKEGNGAWSKPINMGYPINTVNEEKTISVSADGKTAYVGAYYSKDSRGDADIFMIDISFLNLEKYINPK
jgi:tetratricopeptide (TPR) repeat protein